MTPKPKALAWPSSQVHRPGAKKSEVSDAEEVGLGWVQLQGEQEPLEDSVGAMSI